MPFVEMVKQVHHYVTIKEGEPTHPDTFYLWIDIVALNQHTQSQLNAQADVSLLRSLVKSCPLGLAFVVDSDLKALSRTWCVFEAWSFVYHGGGGGINKLKTCLPLDVTLEQLLAYEDLVDNIDLNKTETSKGDDKIKIITEVKSSAGLKLMLKQLQEALTVALRSGLRWGSGEKEDLRSLGLYATLLLKGGEYHRLQRLLYEISCIQNDEDMLKEVENIFTVYVDGPDDELDEDQFCEVLLKAGFTSDEVHEIYTEVNQLVITSSIPSRAMNHLD